MTDQTPVTLDEVRARFLEAESRLVEAASAIRSIEDAASHVGAARDSLTTAGNEIRNLAGQFGDVASSLHENAEELRRGVDAIRLGDPAAVRRQIEELDAAFNAMQKVVVERFGEVERAQTSLGERQEAASKALHAAQIEARVIGVAAVLLIASVLILTLIR